MKEKSIYLIIITVLVIIFFLIYVFFFNINKSELEYNKTKIISDKKKGTYSEETANLSKTGTTIYLQELVYDGYTIMDNLLIDINGIIIKNFGGELVSFFPNKDYVLKRGIGLAKLNSNGNLIWDFNETVHHEIFIGEDQSVIFASKEIKEYAIENITQNVEFDIIYHLDSDGNLIEKYSFFEHLEEFRNTFPIIFESVKKKIPSFGGTTIKGDFDYFHLNSIQIIPNNKLGEIDKRFQKGNWLISINHQKLMLILDKNDKSIVWSYALNSPLHGPRILSNGNILFFYNGRENCSKVLEINPLNNSIIWEYNNDCSVNFYSINRAFAQRLPNNNTLITETTRGRAFEITKEKEIVWEWYNPDINNEQKRHTMYRAIRVNKDLIE